MWANLLIAKVMFGAGLILFALLAGRAAVTLGRLVIILLNPADKKRLELRINGERFIIDTDRVDEQQIVNIVAATQAIDRAAAQTEVYAEAA